MHKGIFWTKSFPGNNFSGKIVYDLFYFVQKSCLATWFQKSTFLILMSLLKSGLDTL